MSIKKLDDGRYEVDVRPNGRDGKRVRRKFDTKGEAQIFERHILVTYHNKEWLDKPTDRRRLTELLDLWWDYHGQNQEHGRQYYGHRKVIIRNLQEMGVTRADQLTKKVLMTYISRILASGLKAKTVNRQLAELSGVFSVLIKCDEYHGENPISQVKALKLPDPETTFLTMPEIERLLARLDEGERKAALLSLSTGARWGEVIKLKNEHIINNRVVFVKTKNSRKRVIPISPELAKLIKTDHSGPVIQASYELFRRKLKDAKPDLPKGQATHVLRHTFATHFMMNGGNIITLQRILGHATIQQTMTYAHFAPDFLQDAVTLNPVAKMSTLSPQGGNS